MFLANITILYLESKKKNTSQVWENFIQRKREKVLNEIKGEEKRQVA